MVNKWFQKLTTKNRAETNLFGTIWRVFVCELEMLFEDYLLIYTVC